MKKFFSLLCVSAALTAAASGQNNQIKNLQPTGDLGPLVAALESARLYPVFNLPMGTGFYDFELKATVTNYTGGALVYFYASVNPQPANPVWDANPFIYFTKGAAADPRAWLLSNPALSIYGQLGSSTSTKVNHLVVIPSKISGSDSWMYRGNTHLVWSFLRLTTVGPELDTGGNQVWTPVVPVDWRAARITP